MGLWGSGYLCFRACYPNFYLLLDREPVEVNLAGKVKNLFLVTIDVYRLENRKIIEVCRVSVCGGTHGGFGVPGSVKFHK